MLSEKNWRPDAAARLAVSVVVCVFIGATAQPLVRFFSSPQGSGAWLFPAVAVGAIGCFLGALVVLGRPWREERMIFHLLALMTCLCLGLGLAGFGAQMSGKALGTVGSTADIVVTVVCLQGGALILTHRFVREHQTSWSEAFGFRIGWQYALATGIMAGFVCLFVAGGMQQLSFSILEKLQLQPEEQIPVQVLRGAQSVTDRVVIGIAAIGVAPVAEEVLFRGIAYPAIKRLGHPQIALWTTALVFGAIHMNLPTFVPLTVLALLLTWLYERTNNLLAPIAAHCCFNALNFTLLYAVPWLQEKFKFLPQP